MFFVIDGTVKSVCVSLASLYSLVLTFAGANPKSLFWIEFTRSLISKLDCFIIEHYFYRCTKTIWLAKKSKLIHAKISS